MSLCCLSHKYQHALLQTTAPIFIGILKTPKAQISLSFNLRRAVFKIQGCRKSEMHWMTVERPQALNCQKYPVYTEYLPPNFTLFCSMTSYFRDTGLLKIGNAPNDLKHLEVSKVPCIQWIHAPEAQISLRFALRSGVFEIQGCQKLEMHPMTPEWP